MSDVFMGGCINVDGVKVNMPPRLARRIVLECPTDKRRTRCVIRYGGAWYDDIVQCCACGDRWSGGYVAERPFRRGWREEAKREARQTWSEAVDPRTYRRLVEADIREAIR